MANKGLLMLVDGHALVHRAYHALPPLTVTKTGEMVNAVFGFANMLLKVLNDLKPTHGAVAFDRPTPTFRHVEYEPYKAQRPPAPDDLVSQFQRVRHLVQAFNIPIYEIDGYEADDVIGTLCRQAAVQGIETIIVTGDADAFQLVSPQVRVLTSKGRFGDTIIYDEATVRERYGIAPQQIADLKGLQGDPSDNIPGVPGIGEKTATKLLQQFGSVEGIYEHLDKVVSLKLRELLREKEELARQSQKLATIVTDVPITLDLEACHLGNYNRSRVVELFRELEFNTILKKLPPSATPPLRSGTQLELIHVEQGPVVKMAAAPAEREYQTVASTEALDGMMAELSDGNFSFDTESTDLDPMRAELVGLSFSPALGRAYYVPVGHKAGNQLPLAQVLDRVKPILEDASIPKVAHNGKYDMALLANYGVEVRNLSFDTMVAAHLLGEKSLGLKALAFGRLGVEMPTIDGLLKQAGKSGTMADVDIAAVADYACADADMTFQLRGLLEEGLKRESLWRLFTEVEMPLVSVLMRMERNGIAIDVDILRRMSQEMTEQIGKLEIEVYNSVGHVFNINSTQQLGAVLFGELRLSGGRKTKSGYSTEASILESLREAHPVVALILDYRQITKLKSTYVDAFPALVNPKTGRLHTSFNQTGTATGRLSSSEPNLQNIPIRTELGRSIRYAFVARVVEGGREVPSLLLASDYSQIDLRALAHLSQDPGLREAFANDEDIHAATASQVFGVPLDKVTPEMRRVAKTVNFGVIYGMSDYGLSQGSGLSRQEAAQFISAYFEKYKGVKEYLEATKRQAKVLGYVQTVLGRRRYIPEIQSSNAQIRAAAERMAINMPVQGTSADIVKLTMIDMQREMDRRGLRSKMVLQIHDELLFEVPEGELQEMEALARERMPKALELSVPLKVDTKAGRNWGEME